MAAVNIDDKFLQEMQADAEKYMRSTPRQIEYWCKIGKLVSENPEYSLNELRLKVEWL